MADKKPLIDKIAEFVEKTGFPLENDCIRFLSSKGWSVTKGPSFLDQDESILREVDISAFKMRGFGDKKALPFPMAGMELMVECKTRAKPWIFFPAPAGMHNPLWCIRHASSIENLLPRGVTVPPLKPSLVTQDDLAGWKHPYSQPVSHTNAYLEYTDKPKDASGHNIRSALMTAVKSTDDYIKRMKEPFDSVARGYALFCYPIVVLRGMLFEATTDVKGQIIVKSSNHVRVDVDYLSPDEELSYGRARHVVDVLHETALADYVESVEASHDPLFERVGKLLSISAKSMRVAGDLSR